MVDLWPWQDAIHTRLTTNLPNNPFFLEGTPEDTQIPETSLGMVVPFGILWFGQLIDGGPGFSGIMGTRLDTRRVPFLVQLIAPTGRVLLQFENAVRDLLLGFRPNGEGELKEDSGPSIREPYVQGTGVDTRFYKPLAYSGVVASVTEC